MVPGDVRLLEDDVVVGCAADPKRAVSEVDPPETPMLLGRRRGRPAQADPRRAELYQGVGGDVGRPWIHTLGVQEGPVFGFQVDDLDLTVLRLDTQMAPGDTLVLERNGAGWIAAELERRLE